MTTLYWARLGFLVLLVAVAAWFAYAHLKERTDA